MFLDFWTCVHEALMNCSYSGIMIVKISYIILGVISKIKVKLAVFSPRE